MSNEFDQDAALAIVQEIEREFELIKSSQGKHMKYARERRDVIKEIKKSAKEDGLPGDVIDGLLEIRKANQKIHDVKFGMSPDYKPIFKPLAEALGKFADSPLGQAAAQQEQRDMFTGDENTEQTEQTEQTEPVDPDVAAAAQQEQEQQEGAQVLDLKGRRPKA